MTAAKDDQFWWMGCLIPIGLAIFLIAQCSSSDSTASDDAGHIIVAKESVSALLRDPDSAEYQNVRVSRASGMPVVCGEVNATNGFGGKSGYQRFISAGPTVLETQMDAAEFSKSWSSLCL